MTTNLISPIPGWSLVLLGPPGSGKTHSLLSLRYLHRKLKCEPFEIGIVAMDKNVRPVLGPWIEKDEPDTAICRVHTINMGSAEDEEPFGNLMTVLDNVGKLALNKIPGTRKGYSQMTDIIKALRNFTPDRGEPWGNVAKWGSNRILVLDNLTNLTLAAQMFAIGNRPSIELQEYGTIQNILAQFLHELLYKVTCHVVLMCHVERETDEVTMQSRIFPKTIGKKLGPNVGQDFSDIVYQQYTGGKWTWTTVHNAAELRPGHLPVKDNMDPDFGLFFLTPEKGWLAKGGIVSREVAKR